jgi:sugar lactone lactonase YvrE
MAGRILRFAIRRDGSLETAVTFARVTDAMRSNRYDTPYEETGPDGLEIGPNGEIYVALYGEGRLLRFAPNGTYRGAIELPTRYATNITFLPDGRAATTGAFDNVDPPYRGEVRFHAPRDLTTTRD